MKYLRVKFNKILKIGIGFIFVFTFIISFLPNTASAVVDDVQFGWAKGIGSTASDGDWAVTTDSSGNVYTAGLFSGTVDFDPANPGVHVLTSAGGKDIYISKLNPSGDFVWAKSIGGTGDDVGRGIFVDSIGIYTAGNFSGTVDFDPGAGTSNLISAGLADIFVLKLDSTGDFVWAKNGGGQELI